MRLIQLQLVDLREYLREMGCVQCVMCGEWFVPHHNGNGSSVCAFCLLPDADVPQSVGFDTRDSQVEVTL